MPLSLEQWIYAIKRHWFLAMFVFVSIMSVAVVVILFAPRAYRSEGKMLLRIGRESVSLDPTASTVGDTLSLHHTRENEIQSALGVMQSREILDHVVDMLGVDSVLGKKPDAVDADPETPSWLGQMLSQVRQRVRELDPVSARESAVNQLASNLDISAPSESSVVSVSFKSDSPELARDVVDAWIKSYIAQHARVNRAQGSYAFFEEQGVMLQEQLTAARTELLETKNRSHLVTIEGQQKLLEAQLSKVRDNLIDVEAEIAALGSRLKAYDKLMKGFDETITQEVTGIANEGRDSMRTQLFELEVLEKDLRSKYREGHPKLVAIERQLEDAAKIVDSQTEQRKEVTRSVNPAYQQLVEYRMLDEATLNGAVEKQRSLTTKQESLQLEIAELNVNEQQVNAISNDVKILEDRYAHHAEKMEQARLDDVLASEQITSVNIVQPASLEQRPIKPNKPLCAVAGLFAALAAAISLPVLVETASARRRKSKTARAEHGDWNFDERENAADAAVTSSKGQAVKVSSANSAGAVVVASQAD